MKKISLKYIMLLLTGFLPLSAMAYSANVAGAAITLTSILVVVVVFVLLFFALSFMRKFHLRRMEQKAALKQTDDDVSAGKERVLALTTNELAAISVALYKYSKGLRESEQSARMMNKAAKANSPWTLRRYNSRPLPLKRR